MTSPAELAAHDAALEVLEADPGSVPTAATIARAIAAAVATAAPPAPVQRLYEAIWEMETELADAKAELVEARLVVEPRPGETLADAIRRCIARTRFS